MFCVFYEGENFEEIYYKGWANIYNALYDYCWIALWFLHIIL